MEFIKNKKSIIIIAIVSIIILGTIAAYLYKINKTEETEEYEFVDNEDDEDNIKQEIMVHITGEVNKPGIVILEEGDRIIDAIEEARGPTDKADLNRLNLAQTLNDGEKIYVPSIEEENNNNNNENNNINNKENNKNSAMAEKININTATKEQLTTLDGIASAIAERIIEYRKENGKFKSTDELKNIQGIGEGKFETIKDKVTIK